MDFPSPRHRLSLPHFLLFLVLLVSSNLLTFFLVSSPSTSTSSPQTPSISLSSSPPSKPALASKFLAFTSPHPLPFGHNHNFDSATLHPPVGLPFSLFPSNLATFLSYAINGSYPDDESLAQKLLLCGCKPLPRRRCCPTAPPHPSLPLPLPLSLWSLPPDNSIH